MASILARSSEESIAAGWITYKQAQKPYIVLHQILTKSEFSQQLMSMCSENKLKFLDSKVIQGNGNYEYCLI